MSVAWYVATTEAYKGRLAESELLALGFDVFFPKVKVTRQWSRNRTSTVIKPYIPGYIFTRFDIDFDEWEKINHTRGVKSLIYAAAETPVRVRDEALEPLLACCDHGFVREQEADEALFRVGMDVKVTQGPLIGLAGRVASVEVQRIQIVLTLFCGRNLPAYVPAEALEVCQ